MKSEEDELVEPTRSGTLPSPQLLLAGLLALQLEARNRDIDKGDGRRPEVILVDLGMTLGQIASLTGRNYETVKSTIRRAKARQTPVPGKSTEGSEHG